jgi:hypothetical protein
LNILIALSGILFLSIRFLWQHYCSHFYSNALNKFWIPISSLKFTFLILSFLVFPSVHKQILICCLDFCFRFCLCWSMFWC